LDCQNNKKGEVMTAQIPEVLIYNGKKLMMCTEPLDLLIKQTSSIQFESPNTACWRGYLGTWKIKGSKENGYGLYLIELVGYKKGDASCMLRDIFPDCAHGVFAHWFSGELRCHEGEQLKYVHMGYGSTYERDLILEIKKGIFIKESLVENS